MSKKSRSKLWFLVHSWLALPIWFFVLIVCVTGTLAVVSQEIVWLANPQMRASAPEDDAPRLNYDQIVAAIKQAEPDIIVDSISRPDESHFALDVGVTYPDTLLGVAQRDAVGITYVDGRSQSHAVRHRNWRHPHDNSLHYPLRRGGDRHRRPGARCQGLHSAQRQRQIEHLRGGAHDSAGHPGG